MSSLAFASVIDWHYNDIAARAREAEERAQQTAVVLPPPGPTEQDVALRVATALAEAEARWFNQNERQEQSQQARMTAALDSFAAERANYFQRVETEIVHLALGIARKILDREAEIDPTLLRGLVRIALDRMGAGSTVRLRVPPDGLSAWEGRAEGKDARYTFELIPDETLQPGDCVVETDLGKANFSFEAQLKEIEGGLLGILAQRPESS